MLWIAKILVAALLMSLFVALANRRLATRAGQAQKTAA